MGISKMGIDSKKTPNSDQILLLARGWDLGIGLGCYICMWKSRVDYSVTYFDRIAVFEAPYR